MEKSGNSFAPSSISNPIKGYVSVKEEKNFEKIKKMHEDTAYWHDCSEKKLLWKKIYPEIKHICEICALSGNISNINDDISTLDEEIKKKCAETMVEMSLKPLTGSIMDESTVEDIFPSPMSPKSPFVPQQVYRKRTRYCGKIGRDKYGKQHRYYGPTPTYLTPIFSTINVLSPPVHIPSTTTHSTPPPDGDTFDGVLPEDMWSDVIKNHYPNRLNGAKNYYSPPFEQNV